jgi:F-type H+-transporting ATPase subunit epsilon
VRLEIITPDKQLFEGKVSLVQVPGSGGSFEVLRNHAPIISTLDKGTVRIVENNNMETEIDIISGVIEVNQNKIIILAEVV